jgi:Leucine-rich repeat (LRR) protein
MSKRKREEEEEEDRIRKQAEEDQSNVTINLKKSICSINFRHGGIYEIDYEEVDQIPEEIFMLKKATSLRISHDSITYIPKEISKLADSLICADFNHNSKLCDIPKEIGALTKLYGIELKDCDFKIIPSSIFSLINIVRMNMSGNKIKEIPKEIGLLTNLKWLYLARNLLTELPIEIGQLSALETLGLRENQIASLPKEIGQLTNLDSISLSENCLTYIPVEISLLTNLTSLDLNDNKLTTLPIEITKLTTLGKAINVFDNFLEFQEDIYSIEYSKHGLFGYMTKRAIMFKLGTLIFTYRMRLLHSQLAQLIMHYFVKK